MFVKRLSIFEENALYETAEAGAAFLDSLGYAWWLSHGTLYGSWCFHGVIPWDDDLDFAFPREHVDELRAAALARGWGFARLNPFLAKIWDPRAAMYQPCTRWSWPFIDIALYDHVPTHGVIVVEFNYCQQYRPIPIAAMMPTRPYQFGPLKLPVPRQPEVFLDVVYKDWRTRALSNHYNHRQERLYDEPQRWADISELKNQFTFYNVSLGAPALQ